MIPYIYTPFGQIPTYVIMVAFASLIMILSIHIRVKKLTNYNSEEAYIFPKIVISMGTAYLFAAIFDALFKIRKNGGIVFSGITYYGGLIGAIISMYITLSISKNKTQNSVKQWFDILTPSLLIFHFFGRLGCFFAGCCYGKNTDSILGIQFPDNYVDGIFHNGLKCYPTQLFEAAALLIILVIVYKSKNKFVIYILSYTIFRFFNEFLRGDERGSLIIGISPAQLISIILFCTIICYKCYITYFKMGKNSEKT